jgi:hypothetical protein
MKLSYAFLADYARVENGKVYVIGGGVTVLWRPEFPAAIGATVVMSFAYNATEAGSERSIQLRVNDADGNEIAPALEGTFVLPPRNEGVPTSVPLEAAFAIGMAPNIPVIPSPGNYVIEISADGNHVRSLPFAAVPAESS